jgi:hypothetical protein
VTLVVDAVMKTARSKSAVWCWTLLKVGDSKRQYLRWNEKDNILGNRECNKEDGKADG